MSAAAMTTTEVPEEAPATRGRLRILVLLAVVAVVGGAAVWFFLLGGDDEADGDDVVPDGEIVVLEPQTTTLGESGLQHVRVTLGVVLADGVAPDAVTPRAALLQDALIRELATMDGDQVRSAEGSQQLRDRLTTDARSIWGDDVALRVVLTELLVQ